jgi:ethanolamine utilization protein EutA
MLAGVRPEDIDTGIVILTGEALRRENAERIARILSEKCGELVCASAGHHMEAMLAAYGSGAAQASYERNERILNVDIGGGTTKLSIIENGKVVETGALHIGARLIAIDKSGRIARLEPAGRLHAARAGFAWQLGVSVTAEQLATVAASMTNDLIQALTVSSPSPEVMALYLSKPILSFEGIGSVIFSGGVAEFIYGRETRDFGDLGRHFGVALRHNMDAGALPWRLLTESQGIRSTALGASEHTVQLSGSTTYISDPAILLPKRNLQVLRPEFTFDDDFDPRAFADAVQKHLSDFGISPTANFALALHWRGQPDFRRIEALAIGIRQALSDRIALKLPCYLVLDADIAMTLGALLRDDLSVESELLVIDGIALWDFDYIDIGKLRMPSGTVSVTIKSLIFHEIQLRPQRYALANVD